MKILKTFLLVIYAAIANAQDLTLDVRVVKHKGATASDQDVVLSATDGTGVSFKFLNAATNNNVKVVFKKDTNAAFEMELAKITEFELVDTNQVTSLTAAASLTFSKTTATPSKGTVKSENLLETSSDKTISGFTADSTASNFVFKDYYLKYDGVEVKMILSKTGVALTKVSDLKDVTTPDFTKLKLHKITGDATDPNKLISLSAIKMIRTLTADQQVKQDYTKPSAAAYTMTVLLKEYYDGDTKKTLNGADASTQDLKFIFPEEKKNKLQDGGIKISFKDGTSAKKIDLYQNRPKMEIKVKNGNTDVKFTSAKLALGYFMFTLHLEKDDKVGMNFTVGNTNDPEFFLTENKTIGFLAEISSDVTVPKKTSAIQAWRKTGGGMTFNDVLPISAPEITLARMIDTIKETTPCSNTNSGTTTGASAGTNSTTTNGTNGTDASTADDKCKNGVSQYVLAPVIAVASLFAFIA